ncbi:MAG: cell division protein FtsZ [Bacteroidales bacterium]|nr:cell division protein FtsZ [Bacteroidales bacterium]
MSIEEIEDSSNFVIRDNPTPEIMVIGVGGGGNNAINNMFKQNIKDVEFVVCNTDRQALKNSPVPTKLLLGPNTTFGRGAGNKPELARIAAEESVEDIEALFSPGINMVFVTAGMGGGTGTGAAPIVAKVAKEKGLLTVGIVTIPFLFEGEKKILKALDGANEMSKHVDALLVINNQRLNDIYGDLDFLNAFGKADDTLTTAARSISELITEEGYVNLDFNDVDTTLRNGGAAIISSGYGEGEGRVTKAFQDAINSPLLKNRDILKSKKLLFNIYFAANSSRPFTMNESNEITSFITNINPDVDIIWGATIDESLGESVKITILAAGFDVTLSEDKNADKNKTTIFFSPKKPEKTEPQPVNDRIRDVYGGEKIDNMQRLKDSQRYITLSTEMMDDDSIVELLEKFPTYNRDKDVVERLRNFKKTESNHNINIEKGREGQTVSFM